MGYPPLRFLHADATLSKSKLAQLERLTTDQILATLILGEPHCLKARADGTLLDGHQGVFILRARGVLIDLLPREVLPAGTEEFINGH